MAISYKSLILSYLISLILSLIIMIIILIYNLINIFIKISKFIFNNFICIYKKIFILLFLTINDDDIENEIYYNTDIICPICIENKINTCCIPCGHTYCNNCIKNTNKCFICRKSIDKYIKIYI
jgi:hypothetical protein